MSAELIIEEVSAGYDNADVLESVSLQVRPGTITCLMGSNGSGKTSLIRSILSLMPRRSGRILLDGIDLTALAPYQIIAQGVSCIPEGRKVFPKLTVEENLLVGAYCEKSHQKIARRIDAVYERFPRLRERRAQLAGTLSGGEQAMVSIGRGLMNQPRLLLIDEPSLGLSPLFIDECFNVIKEVQDQGVTVFLVEQNVHQSLDVADFGYVLSKGSLAAQGTPQQLLESSAMQAAYFGRG